MESSFFSALRYLQRDFTYMTDHHGDVGDMCPSLAEAIRRKLADLKSRLAGDTPTQLEALLIERIGLCWLAVNFAEIDAADARLKDQGLSSVSLLSQKRLDSAHLRYLYAIRGLATIRRLLKPRQKAKPQTQRRHQELGSLCGASVSN